MIEIQDGSRFLYFGMQGKEFRAWFECLVPGVKQRWEFRIFGTGVPIPENFQWLATHADESTATVWHLYERFK